MEMRSVKSSNVAEIGHTKDVLRVKFRDGTIYEYDGVNQETFKRMAGAESVGQFLSREIRGKFRHRKVDA